MRYDKYAYLWPPRPDHAISPSLLPSLERHSFAAQVKKNGICSVIAVSPEGEIIAKNRHREDHKAWVANPEKMQAFTNLPRLGWNVFVAELLHGKVTGMRDIHYIHDILVHNSDYLVGKTQLERRAILCSLFQTDQREEAYSHYVIDEYTWVARQFDHGFKALYDSLVREEDEGLVLKDSSQRLKLCIKQNSNNGGMLKARKAKKSYSF